MFYAAAFGALLSRTEHEFLSAVLTLTLGRSLHRREWDTPDSCVTRKVWEIPACHRYQVSTSCTKIGFLLRETWGIGCSLFFFRNCLSSGNELEGPIRRKQGSHNGCNMAHGKELRTESLINLTEISEKTTSASSAACAEMWIYSFSSVGTGVSWGGDHFST